MAVEFKGGVNFEVIPQIRDAVSKLEHIFARFNLVPIVTSAKDSVHGSNSLHYIGAAVDLRSKGIPATVKNAIYGSIKATFPAPTWYTDLEFPGGNNEHFHIGYNPARRASIDSGIVYSYLPSDQPSFEIDTGDQGYSADPNTEYPATYPEGTIQPQYFTPYELKPGWMVYIGVALFAVFLWYATDD